MQDYIDRKHAELKTYIRECEQRFGMTSEEFLSYYRELESHGLEEEYDWYVALNFLAAA
ncbi:hypothetical protein JJB07_11240 [Tumebacillus sp. ITR2]|jgi:hypothetical protein|uniref:Uncharacterized protein n=1 Tax=Tumebacillus amylolyticus TaxID=2801339 RepID=A0ABS1JAE5_9BACL|nr:hypothetical protein [Tumebacillus amylolyticus]MBL0387224.1 hypothetical protein [Tumebacillus amylolyticus]